VQIISFELDNKRAHILVRFGTEDAFSIEGLERTWGGLGKVSGWVGDQEDDGQWG